VPYLTPGDDIVSIFDAPRTPLALLAPGGRYLLLVHYQASPPVALLARRYLPLAGIRIDPELRARQRTSRLTGLSVLRLAEGTERPIELPAGAQISLPAWAPDGRSFAFTIDDEGGAAAWTGDAETATAAPVPGLWVSDVLSGDPPALGSALRWCRDGRSLLALAIPGTRPELPEPPAEPLVSETAGKRSQMATYQDLLRGDADARVFELLATTVPVRADPASGVLRELGQPGLYRSVTESPDGSYLLVGRLQRPFSFRVPFYYFARRAEVWPAEGVLRGAAPLLIADLPVSDEVPRQGVPAGPRRVSWLESAPATLVWAEALDGGDPVAPADHRDRIMRFPAPFENQAEQAFLLRQRCVGWAALAEQNRFIVTEHDRDRRWLTTWLCNVAAPETSKIMFDLAADDAYRDPGSPLLTLNPDGTQTALQHGTAIYLRGDGATPDGYRPFLDRLDLATMRAERLYASADGFLDQVLGFAAGGELVLWRESPSDPPNLFTAGPDDSPPRQLTSWPDPHPQLTGMRKKLIVTDRGDGVKLSGLLHLPPGHDPARDERLPLLIWAYPHDYGTADTAGQVRGTSMRFTRFERLEPAWFVLRGYAVLADATMPVIGDPETKNDSYIEQISAAAAAHIRHLDEAGIIDPARVAVGGHSYGGFMTANLLAHTGLFAAGIARSGAYNRTLTPFGFQTERRSFWEAPQVYDRVSPFRYADRISAPILLIHGMADDNSGTFPIQSERLFQAIQGSGGMARLVLLPYESHNYLARESILHVLAEQFCWLDRWLKAG
jgi:dipeptidyl aminopeptidase/acylaminoacyl peptidase